MQSLRGGSSAAASMGRTCLYPLKIPFSVKNSRPWHLRQLSFGSGASSLQGMYRGKISRTFSSIAFVTTNPQHSPRSLPNNNARQPSAVLRHGAAAMPNSSSSSLLTRHAVLQIPTTRSISSLVHQTLITPSDLTNKQLQSDLDYTINLVRKYDPAGYLPGFLLPTNEARVGYYAIRSFWVETGLKFSQLSQTQRSSSSSSSSNEMTATERVQWWRNAVEYLYSDDAKQMEHKDPSNAVVAGRPWNEHPTVRLLHHIMQFNDLSRVHFDTILQTREDDINLKQYPTLQSLIDHAQHSCGSLLYLLLECSNVPLHGTKHVNTVAYDAAREVGITHGLTNALRTSIPVASATGRIIVPADLCVKYGVKSPRYLLSSLGMGDEQCRQALQDAVRDIVKEARDHLGMARERREDILQLDEQTKDEGTATTDGVGTRAVAVLLPGLASETFLDRLERSGYDLTNRNLRSVGIMEHAMCASRMITARLKKTY